MKKLPKEIFVVWDQPGNDVPYLCAAAKISDHTSMGDKKIVGTYRLVQEDEVTGVTHIKRVKRP